MHDDRRARALVRQGEGLATAHQRGLDSRGPVAPPRLESIQDVPADTGGDEKAVAVPSTALRIEGTRRKLFIIRQDQLEERLVEIGETREDWIEIRQGLADGESVVLNPDASAADGVPVVLKH